MVHQTKTDQKREEKAEKGGLAPGHRGLGWRLDRQSTHP